MKLVDLRDRWSEEEFQTMICDRARIFGWQIHHDRPARTQKGWATPIQGDPGFPDLVLARDGTVIIAELKSSRGRLTHAQAGWLSALTGSEPEFWQLGIREIANDDPDRHVYVWTPADWPHIQDLLE